MQLKKGFGQPKPFFVSRAPPHSGISVSASMKRFASRDLRLGRAKSLVAAREPTLVVCAGLTLALVVLALRIASLW